MENERTSKKRVRIALIVTLLLCLIDIYIIINIPEDYIILAVSAILTLIAAVLFVNNWFKWKEVESVHANEQYSDIMNVQKSSYVIIQKKVQDIDDKINFIGQKILNLEKAGDVDQRKISSILDNIVDDQKKIAKITVSRSKENADALMNSNDKLLLQMEEFRNSIASMQEQLLARQGEIHNEESQELGDNKKEILSRIMELKELLLKEADEISENILTSQQTLEESYSNVMEAAAEVKANKSVNVPAAAKEPLEETAEAEEQPFSEERTAMESVETAEQESITDSPSESIEIPGQESVPEQVSEIKSVAETSESVTERTSEPEPVEIGRQQSAVENLPSDEMREQDSVIKNLSDAMGVSMPDSVGTEGQASVTTDALIPEPMKAEESQELRTAKKTTEGSSVSNDNGMMSPEDIAALIANAESEELPDIAEKFPEEEKPPVPDMSDPNRPMSPEDIAALIANM
ncbi:hypothetical protein AALA98_07185 [Lachnospiraceae bacterium 45-W7]